ncbi:MAG: decaprenylphospho-beta-D-erythro-pentofuranosid-2-ulose 2-reductase [Ilumatobacter sp.]|jgi:decaprenylphospho-beta-D-erythro-pentofuranosid-2-ulose 2-reductase
MNNAIHQPQTIVALGGSSDIARAIIVALDSASLRTVVLGCRNVDAADVAGLQAQLSGASVTARHFDATDHAGHADWIAGVASDHGDLDIVVQAFGQLGVDAADDPVAAAKLVDVNYAGAVSSGLAVADHLRRQGHGVLVSLSSVAGVRTRASNFVYGSTKAGLDAFTTGLGHALHGSGARVMTVRPGMVRTSMTEGMDDAPFTVDAADVAAATVSGLRKKKAIVWAPAKLRGVFGLLRFAPDFVWRKLDT